VKARTISEPRRISNSKTPMAHESQ